MWEIVEFKLVLFSMVNVWEAFKKRINNNINNDINNDNNNNNNDNDNDNNKNNLYINCTNIFDFWSQSVWWKTNSTDPNFLLLIDSFKLSNRFVSFVVLLLLCNIGFLHI